MKQETLDAIYEHAIAEYPRESCGVVVSNKRKEWYVPCRNDSDRPTESFLMNSYDYAAAEDSGEITVLVHSHPDASERPSPKDLEQCEAWDVACCIVAVHGDPATPLEKPKVVGVSEFSPSGYEMPYRGREFRFGTVDCYTMVRDFYKRDMGVTLPDFKRTDKFWERGENLYMDNLAENGFTLINTPTQKGDLVLMAIRSDIVNHAAVWLGEDDHIIHHPYEHLSEKTVLTGYWLENVRHYARRTEQ